jgi:uncharacterized protein YcfJ
LTKLETTMNPKTKTLIAASALLISAQALAQITFYEGDDYRGRAFTTRDQVTDFTRSGFNDRASSVIVDSGHWQACEDSAFRGRCVVLRPGSYDSLSRLGVDNRLSSVRRISDRRDNDDRDQGPEPLPAPDYEYRRRPSERVYQAPVTSVHAVVGRAEQRCWVEREQVEQGGGRNVGGGIVGALIGGVIGHQIGGGRGKELATVGGAVAGAAIGSNQGRSSSETVGRDVRHCETASSGPPEYWDVEYSFRNVDHRIQMTAPPGRSIAVNQNGEPRQ